MEFSLSIAIDLLSRSPSNLRALLLGLPSELQNANEGPETWSPHEVVRHLIYCEETDWIPRMEIILEQKNEGKFDPFDRFAHLKTGQEKGIGELLEEFEIKRMENIKKLKEVDPRNDKWNLKGIHPEFGQVSLKQLISAWVTHDLSHISQICRVLAKQFKDDAGPWTRYMRILNQ